jgi:hypothetical protein
MNHTIHLLEDDDCDLNDLGEPEYDMAEMRRLAEAKGREYRGQFAGRLMRIARDVLEVFPDEESVNQALRELIAARSQTQHTESHPTT